MTHNIITKVFRRIERRGTDASGFWGSGDNIYYYKKPIAASKMVKQNEWKDLATISLDILLVHTRWASQSVGEPHINANNHPFVTDDQRVALIHNGYIPEFVELKDKYKIASQCDSEILLRIVEARCENINQDNLIMGIGDIFSMITGHMAVAIGESNCNLWLFRNQHRSLYIIDLRDLLNQIFFCSTADLWCESLLGTNQEVFGRQKIIKLPANEIWHLNGRSPEITRYQVCYLTPH